LQQPLETFDLHTSYTKLYNACQAPSQRATKEAYIGAWKAVEVEKASIRSLFLEEVLDVAERTRE
jgi:hypothetical protein